MADAHARFERYVGNLSDDEALILHRIVCRRAAHIYEPLYREKREAHFRMARSYMTAHRIEAGKRATT